jgi:indole-3-glycerol phosphate synthase
MPETSDPSWCGASALDRILADARDDVARRQAVAALADVRSRALDTAAPRDFRAALTAPGLSLIAEFKRASPSKGPIFPDADVAEVVRAYSEAGAHAVSVLTNRPYFHGSDEDLRRARAATHVPILRKDFTVSAYQIYEARLIGADAVLLIVSALKDHELAEFIALAGEVGLAALVEVHSAEEVGLALAAGADVIGINNRDLRTFETKLETTERLRPLIPVGKVVVSESGIFTGEDTARLRQAGVDAVLVGESLMRSAARGSKESVRAQIRDLLDAA